MGHNITPRIGIVRASIVDIVYQAEALYECVDRSRNGLKNFTWAESATEASTYAFLHAKILSTTETVNLIFVDHEVAGVFEARRKSDVQCEIGYWLDVKYRGLGIMDIVAKSMVDVLASKVSVFAYTRNLNASSQRILRHAGLKEYAAAAGVTYFMRPMNGMSS